MARPSRQLEKDPKCGQVDRISVVDACLWIEVSGAGVCLGTGALGLMLGSVLLVLCLTLGLGVLLLRARLRPAAAKAASLASEPPPASYPAWAALFQ